MFCCLLSLRQWSESEILGARQWASVQFIYISALKQRAPRAVVKAARLRPSLAHNGRPSRGNDPAGSSTVAAEWSSKREGRRVHSILAWRRMIGGRQVNCVFIRNHQLLVLLHSKTTIGTSQSAGLQRLSHSWLTEPRFESSASEQLERRRSTFIAPICCLTSSAASVDGRECRPLVR